MRRFLCLVSVFVVTSVPAFGWSTKEHIQLTRIAASRLIADPGTPPEMKQWLRDATPGLLDLEGERKWFMEQRQGIVPRGADGISYWAVMPDTTNLTGNVVDKDITVDAAVKLPDGQTVRKSLVVTASRAIMKDQKGETLTGRWIITRVREAQPPTTS